MNIKKKTVIITVSLFIVLISSLYAIMRFVLLENFELLQKNESEKNMLRMSEILGNIKENLNTTARDYSKWDETYAYVSGENPNFLSDNSHESVFANLGLNFLIFTDSRQIIVFKEYYDLKIGKEMTFPDEMLSYFEPQSNLFKFKDIADSKSGVLNLNSGPVMFVSNPVLKTDGAGPAAGAVVLGLYINESMIEKIREISGSDADIIYLRPGESINRNIYDIISNFKADQNVFIKTFNENNDTGYLLVNDINGKPAFLIQSEMPRNIHLTGERNFNYIMVLISIAIIISMAVFAVIINKIINTHESRISHIANHDELTGLPNRRYMEEVLLRAISKAKKGLKSFLILLDLDNFKMINDHFGHNFGDKVLIGLSGHIYKHLRSEDILARFGGDEFMVLIEQDDIIKAENIAERLRTCIGDFDIDIDTENFKFSASMGLVEIEADESVNEILARADRAMYQAKEKGKDQVFTLEREFSYSTTSDLILRLKKALRNKLFTIHYQPIVRISTNEIAYYEALARLSDNIDPGIEPGVFIPVMERYGLVGELTRLALSEVTKILKESKGKCIFINLSAKCFSDRTLLNFIKNCVLESKSQPEQFGFEITESSMLNDISQTKEWISKIKKLGCRFAIDDFGSGFMSFNVLRELPVDLFKIDGKIVKQVRKDSSASAMIKSVKLMANLLGKEIVAEWIENPEIEKLIKSFGIEYGQGFYYAKPGPDLINEIKSRKKSHSEKEGEKLPAGKKI